jgi:hypothetical protein
MAPPMTKMPLTRGAERERVPFDSAAMRKDWWGDKGQ